jgi:hypothetical protein
VRVIWLSTVYGTNLSSCNTLHAQDQSMPLHSQSPTPGNNDQTLKSDWSDLKAAKVEFVIHGPLATGPESYRYHRHGTATATRDVLPSGDRRIRCMQRDLASSAAVV